METLEGEEIMLLTLWMDYGNIWTSKIFFETAFNI